MSNFNSLSKLAKRNLDELRKLDNKIRNLYLESERPESKKPEQLQRKQQPPVAKTSPPPKKAKRPSPPAKIEINPETTPAPIAFAGKISELLHKDQKLRLVTSDFARGKCGFEDWVDTFFEACQGTYNGLNFTSPMENAINILLDKGYTLGQDAMFLSRMQEVARDGTM